MFPAHYFWAKTHSGSGVRFSMQIYAFFRKTKGGAYKNEHRKTQERRTLHGDTYGLTKDYIAKKTNRRRIDEKCMIFYLHSRK